MDTPLECSTSQRSPWFPMISLWALGRYMLEVAPGSSSRHALWHRGEPFGSLGSLDADAFLLDVRHVFADVDSVNFNDLMR